MNQSIRIIALMWVAAVCLSCKTDLVEQQPTAPISYEQMDTSSNKVIHMKDLAGNYAGLQEVIAAHKGKVVYMDIWASWCGPCKAMMPASKQLQQQFKDEDVVFLYVSIDRNEAAWQRSTQQFHLTENSYLAKNYPKGELFQTNNVSTIPRYMLFDKNGRLVDSNAQRPNSRLLVENIKAFLKA